MLCGMWASTALAITAEDKAELERIVRSGRTEQCHALRARIILGAEGRSDNALAKELETSRPTIVDWRARYAQRPRSQRAGVRGLHRPLPDAATAPDPVARQALANRRPGVARQPDQMFF
jgi:hypothetical protein